MTEVGGSIAKGVASLYVVRLATIPLGVVVNLMVGALLVPEDYGAFATANFLVGFLALVSQCGLIQTLIRHPEDLAEQDYSAVFTYQAAVSALLGLSVFLSAEPIGGFFFEKSELPRILRGLAPLPLMNSLIGVPMVRLERSMRYGRVASVTLTAEVLERVTLVGLLLSGVGVYGFVYSRLLGVSIQVAGFALASPWNPFSLLISVLRNGWRGSSHLRFGVIIQLKQFASTLITGIIPGVGGKLFTADVVGLISWSHNMAYTLGQPLPQAAARVLLGASSRLRGNRAAMKAHYENALRVCTALVGTLICVAAALIPEALQYVFNPKWRGAAPYFMAVSVLMLQGVFLALYNALADASGRPKVSMLVHWVWGAVGFGVAFLLGWLFGPLYLVVGMMVANLVGLALMSVLMRGHVTLNWLVFLLPLAVSVGTGVLTWWLKDGLVTGVTSLIAFGAVAGAGGLIAQAFVQPGIFGDVGKLRRLRRQPGPAA